ncbi:hypothetical protein K474DRAFT_1709079 [Panus rudis PR-1116 ss-1]|nr:hypothetical protein K474DRAFT_1709079 [Panus rudis PR-1116 ss-1]
MLYFHDGSIVDGSGNIALQGDGIYEDGLAVSDPITMKQLVDTNHTPNFRKPSQYLVFRMPSDIELLARGYTDPHDQMAKTFLNHIFALLRNIHSKMRVGPDQNVTLILQAFTGLQPDTTAYAWSETYIPRLPFVKVKSLRLMECSFETFGETVGFFSMFPLVMNLVCDVARWPASITGTSDEFSGNHLRLPVLWASSLGEIKLRVSSFGDVWLLSQISRLEPVNLTKLTMEWNFRLQGGYAKYLLRQQVDLRRFRKLNTLLILEIPDDSGEDESASPFVGGSILTAATGLIPFLSPGDAVLVAQQESRPYVNWLNTVCIDLRHLMNSKKSPAQAPQLNELLGQINILKNDLSGIRVGITNVVAMIPAQTSVTDLSAYLPPNNYAVGTDGNQQKPASQQLYQYQDGYRGQYRSEWEKEIVQGLAGSGVVVMFQPA